MKKVISIVAGVATGFIVVFIGNATKQAINPPPLGINFMDKNVMQAYVASIPTYVMVIMVIFWLCSSFLGGMVAARLNRAEWKRASLITGSILMAAAIFNMTLMPHPLWMWITALAGYIPAAFIGAWLQQPKSQPA